MDIDVFKLRCSAPSPPKKNKKTNKILSKMSVKIETFSLTNFECKHF